MATVTATRAGATKTAPDGVGLHVVASSHTLAAPGAGDVLQMVKVPKGARIVDVVLTSTDVDTNGTPTITMTVGDTDGTDDTDRYITSSTIGQAGGVARLNNQVGHLYEFAEDGTIDVTFPAAAATFAAGTITLTVLFTTDDAA